MIVCTECGAEFEPAGKRSSRANRYLWAGVYGPIAKHLGYTPEQIHEAMKDKFLAREDITTGLRIAQSTAKLEPARFAQYIEEVREWSHRFLGLYIASADEREEAA